MIIVASILQWGVDDPRIKPAHVDQYFPRTKNGVAPVKALELVALREFVFCGMAVVSPIAILLVA